MYDTVVKPSSVPHTKPKQYFDLVHMEVRNAMHSHYDVSAYKGVGHPHRPLKK